MSGISSSHTAGAADRRQPLQALVCEWAKVRGRGLQARVCSRAQGHRTVCFRTTLRQSRADNFLFIFFLNLLTSTHRPHCCFLIIKHWLVNTNTGQSYQHLCHIDSCNLTLQAVKLKHQGSMPLGSTFLRKGGLPRAALLVLICVCLFFLIFSIAHHLLSSPLLVASSWPLKPETWELSLNPASPCHQSDLRCCFSAWCDGLSRVPQSLRLGNFILRAAKCGGDANRAGGQPS